MTKQALRKQIVIIATLNLDELQEKEKEISMSMIDREAKDYLYRAIEQSRIHDTAYNTIDSMAVSSSISEIS